MFVKSKKKNVTNRLAGWYLFLWDPWNSFSVLPKSNWFLSKLLLNTNSSEDLSLFIQIIASKMIKEDRKVLKEHILKWTCYSFWPLSKSVSVQARHYYMKKKRVKNSQKRELRDTESEQKRRSRIRKKKERKGVKIKCQKEWPSINKVKQIVVKSHKIHDTHIITPFNKHTLYTFCKSPRP